MPPRFPSLICGLLAAATIGFAADKPNIVIIEVDDLTQKYLGCFDGPAQTPNIDRLANRGVVFQNAICQGTMCGPSRNSLMTGMYPHKLGFYRNGMIRTLPKGCWTFPGALQRSGYCTAWIGKSHIKVDINAAEGATRADKVQNAMKQQAGFDHVYASLGRAMLGRGRPKGFDRYLDDLRAKGLYETFVKDYPKPTTLKETDYMDGYFTVLATQWLREYKQSKPALLWINYSCPHGPYDVPKKYLGCPKPEQMPKPISEKHKSIPNELIAEKTRYTGDKLQQSRANYVGAIEFVDAQVGRIMKAIEDAGKADNTMVAFFSDHGIMTGDHGLKGKGTLFKEVLNPSLIVQWPNRVKPHVVERPVELLDLIKTFLDVAGAEQEEYKSPAGYSLMPLLTGKGTYPRLVAHGEMVGFYAAFDGRYKYINRFKFAGIPAPVLLDLKNDPNELANIASQHPELVQRMQADADAWRGRTGPVVANIPKPKAPKKTAKTREQR